MARNWNNGNSYFNLPTYSEPVYQTIPNQLGISLLTHDDENFFSVELDSNPKQESRDFFYTDDVALRASSGPQLHYKSFWMVSPQLVKMLVSRSA